MLWKDSCIILPCPRRAATFGSFAGFFGERGGQRSFLSMQSKQMLSRPQEELRRLRQHRLQLENSKVTGPRLFPDSKTLFCYGVFSRDNFRCDPVYLRTRVLEKVPEVSYGSNAAVTSGSGAVLGSGSPSFGVDIKDGSVQLCGEV